MEPTVSTELPTMAARPAAVGHPHLALVGMMGSGKTTIGRILAHHVGREVVDLDARLVTEQALSIADMFALNGELWFRETEADLLGRCLVEPMGAVVSVGGGAPLRAESRLVLRDRSVVVWLRATADTLVERTGSGGGRPMLAGNPADRIRQLTIERASVYADAAHAVVDVDDLTPGQAAEVVRAAVYSLDRGHWAG